MSPILPCFCQLHRMPRRHLLVGVLLTAFALLLLPSPVVARAAGALQVAVSVSRLPENLPATADHRAFAGRLFVYFTRQAASEPRFGPNWFQPQPFFARDVTAAVGLTLLIDDQADAFPAPLSRLPAGKYRVQALLDTGLDRHDQNSPGNLYSPVTTFDWKGPADRLKRLELALSEVVPAQRHDQSEHVVELAVSSRLLAEFHGREIVERATVVLPAQYHLESEQRYPVIFIIPGFGSDHSAPRHYLQEPPQASAGQASFIRVYLSGDCRWGHHVYADSVTNGPRGQTLIEEIIPALDRQFRTIPQAHARFLTGHSSGGWSSLWLQITYPETFGGVWSTAPDPVDFRDFQQIDLYADPPPNVFRDPQGNRRPIARRGVTPVLWYEDFSRMDDVIARGGQLRSFEAVFSPRGDDGQPRRLWDRRTGLIDPEVARTWQAYDIRLVLEKNWSQLAPLLSGKLHIYTGSLDTFYLEGAVRLLAQSLHQLGSDATVDIVKGKDHGTLLSGDLLARIRAEMSDKFLASQTAVQSLSPQPAASDK